MEAHQAVTFGRHKAKPGVAFLRRSLGSACERDRCALRATIITPLRLAQSEVALHLSELTMPGPVDLN
jgi:hypothetical protein